MYNFLLKKNTIWKTWSLLLSNIFLHHLSILLLGTSTTHISGHMKLTALCLHHLFISVIVFVSSASFWIVSVARPPALLTLSSVAFSILLIKSISSVMDLCHIQLFFLDGSVFLSRNLIWAPLAIFFASAESFCSVVWCIMSSFTDSINMY